MSMATAAEPLLLRPPGLPRVKKGWAVQMHLAAVVAAPA